MAASSGRLVPTGWLAEISRPQAAYPPLSTGETAESLGVSLRTVELEWRMAKDFLAKRLGGGAG